MSDKNRAALARSFGIWWRRAYCFWNWRAMKWRRKIKRRQGAELFTAYYWRFDERI